jgi:hypothetical protein
VVLRGGFTGLSGSRLCQIDRSGFSSKTGKKGALILRRGFTVVAAIVPWPERPKRVFKQTREKDQ